MVLFVMMGAIIFIALGVISFLFYFINKEGQGLSPASSPPLWPPAVTLPGPGAVSQEASERIEALSKENELLKSQQASLPQAKEKLADLQAQVESANAKARFLEEGIAQAHAAVAQLKLEKESLPVVKNTVDDVLRKEVDDLKLEQINLKQANEDLQRTDQKLGELNAALMAKAELLQYELTKARAQSTGLERIGQNYKVQMEDLFKKIHDAESANAELAKDQNRLEGCVQAVKSQNDDLVKKDRLAQFELEKNRSQLVSLEREYEDFKARMRQVNLHEEGH